MLSYFFARLIASLPVVLGVTIITFMLIQLLPGDAAEAIAGMGASPDEVRATRERLGLDEPWHVQLGAWLWNLAQGDFGASLTLNQPVLEAVVDRLPVTLSLTLMSLILILPIGIGLGTVAASFRNTWIDGTVMIVALIGVSLPVFWIAVLAVLYFSVNLGWVPSSGYTPLSEGFGPWFASVALPSTVLALFPIGFLARITRSAMLEVLEQDYIRSARAKGVGPVRLVLVHAFRNTLIQVVTATGIILSLLISGAVVTETVFAMPGLGRLLVQGIFARDFPLVQGVLLIIALTFVIINLIVDLIYSIVDPRVDFE